MAREQGPGPKETGEASNEHEVEYREPENLEEHLSIRDGMLQEYNDNERVFAPAKNLDGLLQQVNVVGNEWHRDYRGTDRNENVRYLEIPLAHALASMERDIPDDRVDEVIDAIDNFGRADSGEAVAVMAELKTKLESRKE